MRLSEPAASLKGRGHGAAGVGPSRCPQIPGEPLEQLSQSLHLAQHSMFGEGGLKCAWLHPMGAIATRDEVWLGVLHDKTWENCDFWQLFPTGREVAVRLQGPV